MSYLNPGLGEVYSQGRPMLGSYLGNGGMGAMGDWFSTVVQMIGTGERDVNKIITDVEGLYGTNLTQDQINQINQALGNYGINSNSILIIGGLILAYLLLRR